MNDNYEGFMEDEDDILNYDISDLLYDDLLNLPTDINHPDQLLFNNNNNPTSSFIMPPTAAPALTGGVTDLNAVIGGDHQPQTYHYQSPIAQTVQGGGARQYSTQNQNVLERRRRDKIRWRLDYLRNIIPYSIKTDIASILDNVIQYIKTLKHEADIITSYNNQVTVSGQPYIPIEPNSFDLGPTGTTINNSPPWAYGMDIVPNQNPTMFSPVAPFLPPPPPPPQT